MYFVKHDRHVFILLHDIEKVQIMRILKQWRLKEDDQPNEFCMVIARNKNKELVVEYSFYFIFPTHDVNDFPHTIFCLSSVVIWWNYKFWHSRYISSNFCQLNRWLFWEFVFANSFLNILERRELRLMTLQIIQRNGWNSVLLPVY